MPRFGRDEDALGELLEAGTTVEVGDGDGVAHPASRAHSRTAARVFIIRRRCTGLLSCAMA